jgi:hypothetical protein
LLKQQEIEAMALEYRTIDKINCGNSNRKQTIYTKAKKVIQVMMMGSSGEIRARIFLIRC